MSIFRTLASSGEDGFLIQHNLIDDCLELHIDMTDIEGMIHDQLQLVIADEDAQALMEGISLYFQERSLRHTGDD
jgi:hypothetical protein